MVGEALVTVELVSGPDATAGLLCNVRRKTGQSTAASTSRTTANRSSGFPFMNETSLYGYLPERESPLRDGMKRVSLGSSQDLNRETEVVDRKSNQEQTCYTDCIGDFRILVQE